MEEIVSTVIKTVGLGSEALKNTLQASDQRMTSYMQANDQMANSHGASLKKMETQLTQLVETLTKQTKGKSPSTDEHINVLEVFEEKVEKEEENVCDQPSERDMRGECPTKLSDPRSFVIEVTIGESPLMGAVLDMGASINMMPLKVYDKLKFKPLKPTSMTLTMANNSPTTPVGVIEEVHVNVHGLVVPMDFVVLDTKRGKTNRQ